MFFYGEIKKSCHLNVCVYLWHPLLCFLQLTLNWVKNGTLVKDSDHTTWDVSSTLENNQVFYLNISNLKVNKTHS